MIRSQLQVLKERLESRAEVLRQTIRDQLMRSDDKAYAEISGRVLDAGEQAVADLLADARVSELRSETSALAEILAAQQRIADGSYGVCLDCGADIDDRRLDAQPTARRCTACQTRHENFARDCTPSL